MADHAAKGKQLLTESRYTEAIDAYTKALQSAPTSPVYLIARSTAYHRAKQYKESLADADAAVVHANTRAKRELIVDAQCRRGIALYNLGRYADSKFVLNVVKRMNEKEKQHAMFLNMAEKKLAGLGPDDEAAKVTVLETPKLPTEEASESRQDSPNQHGPGTNGKAQPASVQVTPKEKIRHDWYQNSDNVYFTLLAKGVPKDKCQVDIQASSLNISFPIGDTGSDYNFTLDPFFAEVQPAKSSVRVLGTKVEVVLVKATPGQKWAKLEGDEASFATAATAAADAAPTDDAAKRAVYTAAKETAPAYPTSSKNGPKDWDKITKDLGNSDAKPGSAAADDDYDGGDEANHFFKQLFKGSSPEVQRAMMKSYTESNGTALSTNWAEVSKGKVETSPPDGMEAKKWG